MYRSKQFSPNISVAWSLAKLNTPTLLPFFHPYYITRGKYHARMFLRHLRAGIKAAKDVVGGKLDLDWSDGLE